MLVRAITAKNYARRVKFEIQSAFLGRGNIAIDSCRWALTEIKGSYTFNIAKSDTIGKPIVAHISYHNQCM